jgi:excisionase family DNA binding protein
MSDVAKGPASPELRLIEHLLTADEVAEILRVPKSWVYSHVSDLRVIRLGRYVRFRRCDIDEFLERRGACE